MKPLARFLLASSMLLGACAPAVHQAAAPKIADKQPAIDRAKLRAALADRRTQIVQRFVAYREARVYPINSYKPGFQHVWLDEQQHFCAAANLIAIDWGRTASANIAAENNFIKLADVHDGPIADWMLTTGLTRHEIIAIQGPDFVQRGEVGAMPEPPPPDQRQVEITRLYNLWTDVERQLDEAWDESLDDATDALMQHPALARRLIGGQIADAGKYASAPDPVAVGFSTPPPA